MIQSLTGFFISAVEYVVGLDILSHPWTLVSISVAWATSYFMLITHLGDTLEGMSPALKKVEKAQRAEAIREAKKILSLASIMITSSILLMIVRLFFYCPAPIQIPSFCADLIFIVSIVTPLSILLLGLIGFVIENFIFKCKLQNIEIRCRTIDAVIYLKCKRILKGAFLDLDILKGNRFFTFWIENGPLVTIDSNDVAAIFLQEYYMNKRALGTRRFKEGPKSLKLIFPHEEIFPETRYYEQSNFWVLKLNKPTTNSRFAIIDKTLLEEISETEK